MVINCDCGKLDFSFINYNILHKDFFDFYSGEICTNGVNIGLLNFYYCKINCIDVINTVVSNMHEYQLLFRILKHETPFIFRNAALQSNNDVLVNKYAAIMYDRCLKDISLDKYERFVFKLTNSNQHKNRIFIKHLFNKYVYEPVVLLIPNIFDSEGLMLWFSKYSNDFNRSWIRGVAFTLLTTLFFYFIINYSGTEVQYFIIDFKFYNFDKVVEGYICLLDIFNLSSIPQPMQLTISGRIMLFVAKIFIAFGSWQTIYAFYKYKR